MPERARRRLTIIEAQINRMGEIIQRYLSHTRGSPLRNKVSTNDLVRDTLLLLQPVFQQRGVEVTKSRMVRSCGFAAAQCGKPPAYRDAPI